MKLPDDCYLSYILPHEAYYWSTARLSEKDRHSVNVVAAARSGGCAWEFTVVEYHLSGITLHLEMFSDSWDALAQIPEFFSALASGEITTLADVRGLLDGLGAVDETKRENPDRRPAPVECPQCRELGWTCSKP